MVLDEIKKQEIVNKLKMADIQIVEIIFNLFLFLCFVFVFYLENPEKLLI